MINGREFGSRVKLSRQERGLTIEKAAALCGVSESIWRQYERGARFPTLSRFLTLCKVMEQRPEYFISGEIGELYRGMNRIASTMDQLPEEDLEILEATADKMLERLIKRTDKI